VVARTLFERWIVRYSAPESILLDQGKELCNKVMYAMCDLWRIKKKRTSPVQKDLHDNVREHENIIIGGTIAILNAHV
jgi:hypothetical protein